MSKLVRLKCTACRGDEPPLTKEQIAELMPHVPAWNLVERDGVKRLAREFRFRDFAQALALTNEVGRIAEEEGHHPVVELTWGRATVTWWTHEIKGLHQNDFIMAAKTDELYESTEAV
jgi:4a-hydroxytetrahydrobiopterin dehydratase